MSKAPKGGKKGAPAQEDTKPEKTAEPEKTDKSTTKNGATMDVKSVITFNTIFHSISKHLHQNEHFQEQEQ